MNAWSVFHYVLALALAPLLPGLINRVKALVSGRRGPPVLQLYYDVLKLLRKGAVYSRTTTWLIAAGPVVVPGCLLAALALLPGAGAPALLAFPGDIILLIYILALARFFLVLSALDTGSAFEGLGASRELWFAVFCEPALLFVLADLAIRTGSFSLTGIFGALAAAHAPPYFTGLLALALLLILLAENARIPVDDPNTHLELTMVHEVMILDHGGPDLGLLLYGAALKLWLFSALLVQVVMPFRAGAPLTNLVLFLAGMLAVAGVVGAIESAMARLRMGRVPQMLITAAAFAMLGMILAFR